MSTLTFLGTGSSYGVPSPGCTCFVCRRGFKPLATWYRTRSSVLVQNKGFSILVDCSPDFREQALRNNIRKIDLCLVTHSHADAVGGIPDLRGYSCEERKTIPVLANPKALKSIRRMFSYAFNEKVKTSKPQLELKKMPKTMRLAGMRITPFEVIHPPLLTQGFRFNDLAFISDIKQLPKKSEKLLAGIKTLIIMGNSDREYYSHQTIFESVKMAKRLKAKRVFFTHIGHRIERIKVKLPKGMQLAHDGLKIKF
ncbi:MAG: MBL fold metallo-hydrolase [Candidatus Micrarchaeota archaeon]